MLGSYTNILSGRSFRSVVDFKLSRTLTRTMFSSLRSRLVFFFPFIISVFLSSSVGSSNHIRFLPPQDAWTRIRRRRCKGSRTDREGRDEVWRRLSSRGVYRLVYNPLFLYFCTLTIIRIYTNSSSADQTGRKSRRRSIRQCTT